MTSRRIKELNRTICELMEPQRGFSGLVVAPPRCADLGEAVEQACAIHLIPIDQAWQVLEASGLGDARKRARAV